MALPVRRWISSARDRHPYLTDSNVPWSSVSPDHVNVSLSFPPPDFPMELSHRVHQRWPSDGSNAFTSCCRLPTDVPDSKPFVACDHRQLIACNSVDDGIGDQQQTHSSRRPEVADEPTTDDVYGNTSDDGTSTADCEQQDVGAGHRRNARERDRVHTINSTFARLRQKLPLTAAYSATVRTVDKSSAGSEATAMFYRARKLSKVQILRAAIEYIRTLQDELQRQRSQTNNGPVYGSSSCVRYQRQADDVHAYLDQRGHHHRHSLRW